MAWEYVSLRSITQRPSLWNGSGKTREQISYIDVSAISRDRLEIEQAAHLAAASAPSRARKIVEEGDTILATIRPGLKRVAQVPPSLHDQIASTAFCVLRADQNLVDRDYLFFAVSSDKFISSLAEHETGASYPAVRETDVLSQEIPLPPLPTQKMIASVLKMLRAALLLQTNLLELGAKLKAVALRLLFTCGLRGEPLKETEIGAVPESWETPTILELCEILSGGTPRKSIPGYWNGDIPWVSGKDLKSPSLEDAIDHVTREGIEAGSRIAPSGAVLLLVRGMGLAKDLPVAVIKRPMAFNQDVKALVSRGKYTGQFLRSAIYAGKERLLGQMVPSAHGTMTLNLNDVETFRVACPPDSSEANDIAEILETIDRKIDLHQRKRAILEELFKSLLHKLMTGEIAVADLDLSALGEAPAATEEVPV